jgi:hypothetical protein
MKMATPLHPEHHLDQLAGQFAHWRRTRSHPAERIPKRLWTQAAALARVLPYSRVAQHVRVSPSDLQKHMGTPPDSKPVTSPSAPRFVAMPPTPAWSAVPQTMEIARARPDGGRLHVRCPDSTSSVAALVQAFVEGRR